MHVDNRSTLAGMEDYSGACKDCDRHQGIKQTSTHGLPTCLPASQPGQTHTCTSTRTHAYEVHCATVAILSAPCRRLPGATVPTAATNARAAAFRQATIDERNVASCIHWLSCQGRHQWQTPAGQKAAMDARLAHQQPCRSAPPL